MIMLHLIIGAWVCWKTKSFPSSNPLTTILALYFEGLTLLTV
jgi:hypothetical protein